MTDLRGRARGEQGDDKDGRGALEKRRATFAETLDKMAPQFQLALPKGIEARQIIRDAMTLVQTTPALLHVDRGSMWGALMTCSQLGLRPGVLGQAYVLPFKGKAQFVVGYKGLATLANRSGRVAGVTNLPIRRGDTWSIEHGTDARLTHKPLFLGRRPTDDERDDALTPIAYYAIIKTVGGGSYLDFKERWEIEDHRDRFALQKDKETGRIKGPWVDHFDAMALKTVFKYAARLAPLTLEVQQAIAVDETVRTELDPVAPVESQVINAADVPDGADVVDAFAEDDPRIDPTQGGGWNG